MTNTNIIIGVVAILAVVGGGTYAYTQMARDTTEDMPVVSETREREDGGGMMSLRGLLAMGDQKCTFRTSSQNGVSEGTVYVSGGRMRGDFTSPAGASTESTVASHMITDGTEMRMWQDGQSMGFLFDTAVDTPASPDAPVASDAPSGNDRAVDLDMQADYDCESWRVDPSLFVPPQNVEFHSMADMMKMPPSTMTPGSGMGAQGSVGNAPGGQGGAGMDIKAMQCQACESAPTAEAKAQCKVALSCE